jgi:hypothetical protein
LNKLDELEIKKKKYMDWKDCLERAFLKPKSTSSLIDV